MRRILLVIPYIFIFGCSDSAKMESAEDADESELSDTEDVTEEK